MSTVFTLWCTGLPTSGKHELSRALVDVLLQSGHDAALVLAPQEDEATTEDTAFMRLQECLQQASTHHSQGRVAVVSADSPLRIQRAHARSQCENFVEVYVCTPKASCIDRDDSGLWQRALNGELRGFVGIDRQYEPPLTPEIVVDLSVKDIHQATEHCTQSLQALSLLNVRLG